MASATSACVDPDVAASYAAHLLLPEERQQVELHIDTCTSCRELISTVARLAWTEVPELAATLPATASAPGQASERDTEPAAGPGGVLPRGARVGPFVIDRPLDAGGMGLVYTAHDARLDRRVALKGVRELRGHSDQLLREARMMAQLSHPNVVPVYDVIKAHDQIFLAMELVVGKSVRQWLDGAPHRWQAIVDVFLAAGAGLAAAHAAGIVHGDVKPANLLLGDDGRARVTDFGLASHTADEALPGVRGTPAYMAPEQRAGVPCDVRGDQYAFCASLREALFDPHGPPPRGRPPRSLRRILAAGTALEPHDRYRSMTALLRELRAARLQRWRWAVAGIASVALLVALAWSFGKHRVEAQMCEASAPTLVSPWHAEARTAVQLQFQLTQLPYAAQIFAHVETNLDSWTGAFEAARREACEPGWLGHRIPRAQLSAQLSCLEDRAREARALIGVFRDVPDRTIVLNAVAATEQLAPPARCAAPPVHPRTIAAPAHAARDDRMYRAYALSSAGKDRDALPIARAVLAAAEATGDPAARSTALVALGSIQVRLADYEAAKASLLQALQLAEGVQNDRLRGQAWVNVISNEYGRGHHDQVLFLRAPALGAAQRVGDVFLESEIMLIVGGSLSQLGKTSEAQAMFAQAVELRRGSFGDKDGRLASALSSLGNAYAMQGDLARGIPAHRQAVEMAEAAMGGTHPTVGVMHENLGCDFLYGLDSAAALVELDQAVAISGAGSRERAIALTDLGLALLEAGQHARAIDTFDRADAAWVRVNPKHPERSQVLLGRYLANAALHRPGALPELETALTLSQQSPPFERARIQLALGTASPEPRATELVEAAVAGFQTSTLPLIQRDLGLARIWLAVHGAAP
jgi:eukaryotic-like serine/threonine-protein kinase